MIRFLAFALLGLLTACSGDRSAISKAQPGAQVGTSPASTHAVSQRFASLPDRGNLWVYDQREAIRHRGAYTWHPIELSEEHVLRATMGGGALHLTTPDGRTRALRYERHEEHPDGNWTWIGRDENGDDAILTFGEKAVFGSIPNGLERPLRVYTRAGHIWLVESDRLRIAQIDSNATRPTKPDFLKPPLFSRLPGGVQKSPATVVPVAGPTTAAATTTIDVALGYTSGFATDLGGSSQALTRLNYLVEVANQAYVNSQTNVRLRLVRTLQVNYVDATDNDTALEELSGYRENSSIPVPAALQPLRDAGEASGADLVSLVRRFRTPENDGCGVAWLLGFQQQPIDQSWADYAYSVVSDGTDLDETDSKNYFCRDETLAHELSHNMGSAHDRATATGDNGVLDPDEYGRYPYSFGYKTAVGAGNFYTVMAYGDSGQTSYRVFSNPRITFCGGFACGVVNQADNAQSLVQTAPIIASFRASSIPVASQNIHNDIDGDGRSDVLMHRSGTLSYWIMNGGTIIRSRSLSVASDWRVVATGDLDGNGKLDIVWMNSNRQLYLWRGDGVTFTSQYIVQMASNYVVAGTGDVDLDGRDDLLLYRSGQLVQWWMNGATILRSKTFVVDTSLSAVAVGDFNADGVVDVVMRNNLGDSYVWLGQLGSDYVKYFAIRISTTYRVVGAQDINADGKSDLLLFRPGQVVQLLMNGTAISSRAFSLSTSYAPATTGSFDGAGPGDLILQHLTNRSLYLWLGTGSGYSSKGMPTLATGYVLVR